MKKTQPDQPTTPAQYVARNFFGANGNQVHDKRLVRNYLFGALSSVVFIPLLFYLIYGEVDSLALGLTIFFTAYCLLAAVGLYFLHRPAYHTPVAVIGDWKDRVGAFWLMACVFGPLISWFLLALLPLTLESWRWIYRIQVFLSIGLPVFTGVLLLRYVRGKGAPIMLVILLGITSLPVVSSFAALRDLTVGPAEQSSGMYLPYTEKWLDPSSER